MEEQPLPSRTLLELGIDSVTKQPVDIEVFHTLFAGQTNLSGKTTTAKKLMIQAVQKGFTCLAFDTKPTQRELSGFHDIPICYRTTNDPLILMPLLESVFQGRKLTREFSVLSRITEKGSSLSDFAANAKQMEELSRSGWVKDAAHKLADLLRRLDRELRGFNLSENLDLLEESINVLPLNKLSGDAQQLVIKTAFELALRGHNRKTILYLDEGFRAMPQKRGSACKNAIQDAITQGAATELYVWIGTQFLVTTEKDPMRAMPNKLLGRQDHNLEIDASLDLIGEEAKLPKNYFKTLKLGEFVFVPIDGLPKKVYITRLRERYEFPSDVPNTVVPWQDRLHAEANAMEKNMLTAMHQTLEQFKEEYDAKLRALALPVNEPQLAVKVEEGVITDIKRVAELEHVETTYRISHREKTAKLSTEDRRGQVMYVLVNDLEGKPATLTQIHALMQEHGWTLSLEAVRLVLLGLTKREGLAVKDGNAYRLPGKVKVTVEKK